MLSQIPTPFLPQPTPLPPLVQWIEVDPTPNTTSPVTGNSQGSQAFFPVQDYMFVKGYQNIKSYRVTDLVQWVGPTKVPTFHLR